MPPKKAGVMSSLSGLIDSDGDVDTTPSPRSNQENEPVAKSKKVAQNTSTKPRGRPSGKASATTMKGKAAKSKPATSKRAPLQEQDNEQHLIEAGDAEEYDEIADEAPPTTAHTTQPDDTDALPKKPTARRGRPPTKAKHASTAKKIVGAKLKATQQDGEFEYTPTREKEGKTSSKSSTKQRNADDTVDDEAHENPDEHTMLSIEEDDVVEPSNYKKSETARKAQTQSSSARPSSRRRAGSASESERGGDVALRRKLGEMTRKFESLESRYRNLKEIGIVEAEANFDRLKKQSEQRTKAANDLIESLRLELEAQRAASQEAREQTGDLHAVQKSLAASEARAAELAASFNAMKKENQALQARLTAARATPDPTQRGKMTTVKPAVGSNAEVAHALQMAQLKQDLYADLTGLIIRSVDKNEGAVVYDCLQTGCNGSLHFKLSVAPEENASTYDEVEFQYEPRLDCDRDQELIDIMPDYLSDEISFSRGNASKFYSRIADTLTKRLIDD